MQQIRVVVVTRRCKYKVHLQCDGHCFKRFLAPSFPPPARTTRLSRSEVRVSQQAKAVAFALEADVIPAAWRQSRFPSTGSSERRCGAFVQEWLK